MNKRDIKFYNNCAELIVTVLQSKLATEQIYKNFFRRHPEMGKNDRKNLIDQVSFAFRNFNLFLKEINISDFSADNINSYNNFVGELANWLIYLNNLNQISQNQNKINHPPNLPNWLFAKLQALYPNDAVEICKSYQNRAPIDIRLNSFASISPLKNQNTAELIAELKDFVSENNHQFIEIEKNISYRILPVADNYINTSSRINLYNHHLYKKAFFEIQDYGSQMISQALPNINSNLIIDYCAGSGGKTLAVLDKIYRNNKKNLQQLLIIASDNSESKLAQQEYRFSRIGNISLRNSQVAINQIIQSLRLPNLSIMNKYRDKAGLIIVDAPCSSLGTLRRAPEIAWKISQEDINQYQSQQYKILCQAATLLRDGGYLLYSTCSWLDEENQAVICKFLENNNNYQLQKINLAEQVFAKEIKITTPHQIPNYSKNSSLTLNPFTHQTDGFFITLLQKVGKK